MGKGGIEDIEVDLLLEAVFRRYGYDFRHYQRSHVQRRIQHFLGKAGLKRISDLIPRVIHEESFFERLLREFSITVSEIFRNPLVYRSIREKVVPYLRAQPFVRVWIAGCATGEEAYSIAILLKEEGLYDRSIIYATDFNDDALHKAAEGIYPIDSVQQFTQNYQQAGGTRSFAEYYHAGYGSVSIERSLKSNIVFANHNLVTDAVFSEVHLILCRNVLIYFGKDLQERVFSLFCESLSCGGFLCLGESETIEHSSIKSRFEAVDRVSRIYRKY
jgi:chemotaxis protein methyltransferase CheR